MKKIAKFIVNQRYLLLAIFVVLMIASVVMVFYVNINSDILSYLPDGVPMTDGLDFMKTNFGMEGDAIVGVDDVNYAEMESIMAKVSKLEGIKPGGVIWIGSIVAMQDAEDIRFAGMNISLKDMASDMLVNESLLAVFYPNVDEETDTYVFKPEEKAQYLFMLQLNVSSSSDEAMDLLDDLDKILDKYDHSIGGSTEIVREIFSSTIDEMYKYILVAVLVMFIVLLLTTDSLVQPFIFMLTLGVSIIINMGTNLLFPNVSVVTFACSAVLQLGLSMDYAIFLMHAFAEEKEHTLDEKEAMRRAIPKTFSTITASALTTVGGFLALFAMKFQIGADLGAVLAKGVFLSLITVLFLQPCLMLMTSKWSNKTKHKIYLPKFKGLASFSVSKRKLIVVLALILIIPTAVLQGLVKLNYIKFVDEPEYEEGSIQETVATLSNSIIIMVPVDSTCNNEFISDLQGLKDENKITAYMSAYTMMPDRFKSMLGLIANMKPSQLEAMGMGDSASMLTGFVSNGYTLYEVMISCDAESPEAEELLETLDTSLSKCFSSYNEHDGNAYYYMTGMAQAVTDLKGITPTDFLWVTIISILIILVVLIISQKSIKLPIILVAIIELGIFINLSLCYIVGEEINFMCYIILSSIQLGATVDYAILYTDKYQRNLDVMPANEAAYKAMRDSGSSILTSVAIMAGCCLSVTVVATNTIVKQITWLIARGSIISGLLTLVVLPAVLVVFTGNKKLKKRGKQEAKIVKLVEHIKSQDVDSIPDQPIDNK